MTQDNGLKTLTKYIDLLREDIRDDLKEIHKSTKDTYEQAKRTNGRVTRLEERHVQEDKHRYPERISGLEHRWWQVTGAFSVLMIVGFSLFTWGVRDIVRKELQTYKEQADITFKLDVEKIIADYNFK